MKAKNNFLMKAFVFATSLTLLGGVILAQAGNIVNATIANGTTYKLTLNSSVAPSFPAGYSSLTKNMTTTEGNELQFSFEDATTSAGGLCALDVGGKLSNRSQVRGLISLRATFSGNLSLWYGSSTARIHQSSISSGVEFSIPQEGMNYFELEALAQTSISSLEISYTCELVNQKYEVRVYEADMTTYKSYEYGQGEHVDIDEWVEPPYTFEGDAVPFDHWSDENDETVVDNFTMPASSMAIYPNYDMPQLYKWSYDPSTGVYTSTGGGVRPFKNFTGTRYGRLSADLHVLNASTTGIGVIWNAAIAEDDYPYDYTGGSEYYYLNLNPSTGGFQLANVNVSSGYASLHHYGSTLSKYPVEWKNKMEAYKADTTQGLHFTITIEFTPHRIAMYVDESLIAATTTAADLNLREGVQVGVRTNAAGNTCTGFSFDEYVESKNGYDIFDDGSYVSYVNNSTLGLTTYSNSSDRYGLFEADATFYVTTTRAGLLANAYIPESADAILVGNAKNCGYFMHHNFNANGNFTATTYCDGTYQKRPDGTKSNIGVLSYMTQVKEGDVVVDQTFNKSTTTYNTLYDYFLRNKAFTFSKTASAGVTVRYGLKITSTYVALYIGGKQIYKNTTASNLGLFDSHTVDGHSCDMVGFTTATAGVKFSNLSWTSEAA